MPRKSESTRIAEKLAKELTDSLAGFTKKREPAFMHEELTNSEYLERLARMARKIERGLLE